ncbi:YbaK/EbsC family protein [Kitasatospora sp. NPDC004669]|uniref:YbaK/EbsC family protein n=1 Tax=Kitasatospora sp. NPDC004669 TaxID=3154555 RepID=UPI0033B4F903
MTRTAEPAETIRPDEPADPSTYTRLIDLLDRSGCRYRMIHHAAEGRTDAASVLRGHPLRQAAKCLVLQVRTPGRGTRHALAVVPGDLRVDVDAVRDLLGGTSAGFASPERAERLTGCRSGSVVPFAFHSDLELIVDPELLESPQLYFNAARLDRSVALDTGDYFTLARPRIAPVAERSA